MPRLLVLSLLVLAGCRTAALLATVRASAPTEATNAEARTPLVRVSLDGFR